MIGLRRRPRPLVGLLRMAPAVALAGVLLADAGPSNGQPATSSKPEQSPAAAAPAEAAGFTVEFEIKEEKKVRDELAVKVDKLPAAQRTQASDELKWAAQQMEFAAREIEKARAERNEQVRQVHLREAMDKVEMARSYARRVEAAVGLPPRDGSRYVGTAAPAAGGIKAGDSPALRQLRSSAALSGQDKTSGAFGEIDYGKLSEVAGYDPRAQTIVLPNGQTVSVASLQKAVGSVDKAAQGKPLFQKIDVPGREPVWRLTPEARKAINDPARRPAIDKVGGVDLRITFDILSFSGVSEFRPRGPATVVQAPVLVSMRRLVEAAETRLKSAEDWDRLADDVRYPGAIDRIHGFVLAPGDLVLVGGRADRPANRISLDLLMVGLEATWKRGRAPAVSLDKRPGSDSFTVFSRVEEIPFQSRFARLMLDADYAMKHVDRLVYDRKLGEFGRKSLAIDREERPKLPGGRVRIGERQWLSPAPLKPSDIFVSATGRSVLFSASVQRESESKRAGLAEFTTEERLFDRQAALFSEHYPSLEVAPEIAPAGIFRRMHGLVDIAMLGYVLREAEVSRPLLDRLVAMPLPVLRGGDMVPLTYRSFDVDHPEFNAVVNTGGALLRLRPKPRHFDLVNDLPGRLLERDVDQFVAASALATTFGQPMTLPQGTALPEFIVDKRLAAAIDEMRAGRADAAAASLRQLAGLAPFDERVWAQLGFVEARRKRISESNEAIARALALAPGDPDIRQLALRATLEREAGTFQDWPDSVRFEAAWQFTMEARDHLQRGDKTRGDRVAALALILWPDNAEAALIRSMCLPPLSDEARQSRATAIELYRREVERSPGPDSRRALAFALASGVAWDIEAVLREMPSWSQVQDSRERRTRLFRATYGMLDQLKEAANADPESPLAPAIRPRLLMLQQMLAQLAGFSGNLTEAAQAAVDAAQRFPGFAEAHLSVAQIMLQFGRPEEALIALDAAIELDAGFSNALMLRAAVRAERRQCSQASADLARVRKLWGEPHADVVTFVKGKCR